jgi:hypothetical protein
MAIELRHHTTRHTPLWPILRQFLIQKMKTKTKMKAKAKAKAKQSKAKQK